MSTILSWWPTLWMMSRKSQLEMLFRVRLTSWLNSVQAVNPYRSVQLSRELTKVKIITLLTSRISS